MIFRQFTTITLLALTLALPAIRPVQAQGFSGPQKEEIGRIVREYLVQNPEVIQDAITELERRQSEAQKATQATAIRELGEGLKRSVNGIVAGNPNGDVTLVEFFDYNCGYCKQALADVQTLVKGDPKLKVVLMDLPVLGPESMEASRFSLAAKAQISGDKLFDFHSRLLLTRGRVGGERALAVARDLGLDIARLQKDAASPEVAAALAENRQLAEKLGINGTPAFIIGEDVIPGAIGAGPLKQAVAGVRQCGQAVC